MKAFGTDVGTIHFVGIGGIGMSGIAEVMHQLGYTVQGSDISESYVVEKLRKKGIDVLIGHDAGNLGAYQALVNAGKTADDVFIFGIDCDPQAVALIDEGTMYKGCVNTNPEGTGVLAVDAYAKWLAGGVVPGILEVPVFVYSGS